MKRTSMIALLSAAAICAACAVQPRATATIHGTKAGSKITGTAAFTQIPKGLQVVVKLANVPPGKHGFHIHEVGNCGDGGKAAGGHFNPDNVPHGFLPKDGFSRAHAGDFGNVDIGPDGTGSLDLMLMGLTLSGDSTRNVVGRAVILHEKPDDFSQPTGNAGGRIGCGIISTKKS